MNLAFRSGLSVLLCSFALLATPRGFPEQQPAGQQKAVLVLPKDAAPPIVFGATALREALQKRGLQVENRTAIRSGSASPSLTILVTENGHSTGAASAARKPESYAISSDGKTVRIDGSDPAGAMYGEMDAAEQISRPQRQGAREVFHAAEIQSVRKSPYLAIRGVNMFLTVQDVTGEKGAFWSDDYWTSYLDTMARNRYNFLDIHGMCDSVTLDFPDSFPYFVSLPNFPEVGVGPTQAAKNIARLKQVIKMAADRGIKVGYMNYSAEPTIGSWKTRKFGVDERWVRVPQKHLTDTSLEIYTREAVVSFLRQLPELWMFGFRIGESGQAEDFYQKTYVAALAQLPPSVNVYVRTWLADPQKVRDLGASLKNRMYIEPKYNGEQLGLPYQAALGGRKYPPSGSYEDYTDRPRNYSILWQIRAHGTHRVFSWGSPEFARRTVLSCNFGDGAGFSMEPMEAYLPAADYLHNNPKIDHHFYHWMVDRQWAWHLIWGRTAYDPDVPVWVFQDEFIRRFGPEAGPAVLEALSESSKIVPFIYAYHNIGLDHQDFAPEFETGDHDFGARERYWQGDRLVPYGGNNDDFLRADTLDRTAMASPSVYVRDRLDGTISGKMTPFEAADYLEAAASKSEARIEQAAKLNPESQKNFDCFRMDIEAVAWLGRYYANRIRSATHLRFYERTFAHPELAQAYEDLNRSAYDWDHLADIADTHFGSLSEYIRMGVKDFRWRDEGRGLGVDLNQINDLEVALRDLPRSGKYDVVFGHVPPAKAKPGEPLTLTVTMAKLGFDPHVYLFYRTSRETNYKKVWLKLTNERSRNWTVTISGEEMKPGYLDYYFGANDGPGGHSDETIAHRPPYHVPVNNNQAKPTFSHTPPAGPVRGTAVDLAVKVDAKAKVDFAYVYYKRMPAFYDWLRIRMEPGADGLYHASVPLTSEGILYYFEAGDEDGNAANYPNFLDRTPYFVIESWATANAVLPLRN